MKIVAIEERGTLLYCQLGPTLTACCQGTRAVLPHLSLSRPSPFRSSSVHLFSLSFFIFLPPPFTLFCDSVTSPEMLFPRARLQQRLLMCNKFFTGTTASTYRLALQSMERQAQASVLSYLKMMKRPAKPRREKWVTSPSEKRDLMCPDLCPGQVAPHSHSMPPSCFTAVPIQNQLNTQYCWLGPIIHSTAGLDL